MDLLEYQGKQLFCKHGVPVPDGRHAATRRRSTPQTGYSVVIKAQVQIGGRGKAGGMKLAHNRPEAERVVELAG
jgi:succinyl-CoA synthetase beta subunit